MVIGERIRELRQKQDVSGREFARRLKIDHVFLSLVERNKTQSTGAAYLAKIADALHTSTDYLLGRLDDPTFPPTCTQKE